MTLIDRHHAAMTVLREEQEAERSRYLRVLRAPLPAGLSLRDVWERAGEGCDLGHSRTILQQLAELGEAREQDGVWYATTGRPRLVAVTVPTPAEGELLGHWVHRRLAEVGITPAELARRMHARTGRSLASAGKTLSNLRLRPATNAPSWMEALQAELGPYGSSDTLPLAPAEREPQGMGGGRLAAGPSSVPPEAPPDTAPPEVAELQASDPGGPGLPSARTGAELASCEGSGGSGQGPSRAGDLAPPLQALGSVSVGRGASLRQLLLGAADEIERLERDNAALRAQLGELPGTVLALEGQVEELSRQLEQLRGQRDAALLALGGA